MADRKDPSFCSSPLVGANDPSIWGNERPRAALVATADACFSVLSVVSLMMDHDDAGVLMMDNTAAG